MNVALVLVQQGVNPNLVDDDGRTALFWACVHGDSFFVEGLLELGVDVGAKDKVKAFLWIMLFDLVISISLHLRN